MNIVRFVAIIAIVIVAYYVSLEAREDGYIRGCTDAIAGVSGFFGYEVTNPQGLKDDCVKLMKENLNDQS